MNCDDAFFAPGAVVGPGTTSMSNIREQGPMVLDRLAWSDKGKVPAQGGISECKGGPAGEN